MLKIAVITKYPNAYRAYGRYSAANIASYCRIRGYDFILDHMPSSKIHPIGYSKYEAIFRYIDLYDWIVWSDADNIIMDFNKKLEDFFDNEYHFVAGKIIKNNGIEYFHTGFFFIRSDPLSKVLISSIVNAKDYFTGRISEEEAISQLAKGIPSLSIKFIPLAEVCSIPACNCRIQESEFQKGNVPTYDTNKFVLHATKFSAMKQKIEFITNVACNDFDARNSIPMLMHPKKYKLLEIFLQTATTCNARCSTCPHREVYNGKQHMMKESLWEKIIADLGHMLYTGMVALTYNYEPFTDSRILQQIKDLREKTLGCVAVISNCSLITDNDLSFMHDNPPDMFLCSMVSPYQDEYEHRTGLNYNSVLANITALHDNIPNVQINCSVSSIEEADEFRRIFKDRNILLTGLDSRAGLKPQFSNSYPSKFFKGRSCTIPFKTMAIRSDGIVPVCCLDWGLNTAIAGDLHHNTIDEIFHGSVFSRFRDNIFHGIYEAACSNCAEEFGYS